MQPIHDRMPVILDKNQWEAWLSPKVREAGQLQPMIQLHDSNSMQVWHVSSELNRAGLRNDAGLIEPIAEQS
jgi:putative SOS response-associated peptidase YedK